MATILNTDNKAMAAAQAERLEGLYSAYFRPNVSAVKSANATGHFQIFSAIDYSVPLSYSDNTNKIQLK